MLSVAKFQSYRAALICWIISQFLTPLKKIVGGAPIFSGVKASKTQTFYSVCKNFGVQQPLGAEIWYSEKKRFWSTIPPLNLCGYWTKFTKLFSPNAGGNAVVHHVSRFWISLSVPEIFMLKLGRCPKLCQIEHVFFAPKIFWGADPQTFGPTFEHASERVAKFRGDRHSDLGDLVMKKTAVKHKAFPNYHSGWPN